MKRSAADFRSTLREGLSPLGNAMTDDEVVACLVDWWTEPRQGPTGKLFAATALLAYGKLDFLERALELAVEDVRYCYETPARVTVRAIDNLLPLPGGLSVIDSPAEVLAWYRRNRQMIIWNRLTDRFELTTRRDYELRS